MFGLGGTIDDTWRQLFEAYPDREQLLYARDAGEFYRNVLTQLTPATARKLGYENAERLYGLPRG